MTQPVNGGEVSPWVNRCAIAAGVLAAITVLVCGILAILVNSGINLPSLFSVNNLLIGGGAGGIFFALLSLAIKYGCSSKKAQDPDQDNPKGNTGRSKRRVVEESSSEGEGKKPTSTGKGKGEGKGNSPISPDGTESVGARGEAPTGDAFRVLHGEKKRNLV